MYSGIFNLKVAPEQIKKAFSFVEQLDKERRAKDSVEKAIKELGASPDEIADTLYQLGFEGYRDNPRYCPVACYVRDLAVVSALVHYVHVDLRNITGYGKDNIIVFSLPTPFVVQQFLKRFDENGYPALSKVDIPPSPLAK